MKQSPAIRVLFCTARWPLCECKEDEGRCKVLAKCIRTSSTNYKVFTTYHVFNGKKDSCFVRCQGMGFIARGKKISKEQQAKYFRYLI